MKLRQSKTFGMFDDHHRSVRYIHSYFNYRSGNHNAEVSPLKLLHDPVFLLRIQPPMEQTDALVGENALAKFLVHFDGRFQLPFLVFLDNRINHVNLVACGNLFPNKTPGFIRAIVGNAAGHNGDTARWHLVENTYI